tara:strand:+ start:208 stop:450 length:243 start_codon:yes stop_codon:yes gene_type:complete
MFEPGQCPVCLDICGNYCEYYSSPEFEVTEREQEIALVFIESIERLVKNGAGLRLEELKDQLILDNDLWWLSDAEYRIYP